MIKLLNVKPLKSHALELHFSDRSQGIFDGSAYLAKRQGPLLEALRDPAYFHRCFVAAGALCWPNELELSAARLHELIRTAQAT